MTAAVDCVCGEPRSEHKRGTGGCQNPDCGCAKYVAFLPPKGAGSTPAPALEVAALLGDVQADVDREAELAARLAEVERERDEAREQRDACMTSQAEAARKLTAERDGAAERWAKAREEIERLTVLLEQAEHRCRDLQDEDLPEAVAEATSALRAELALEREVVAMLRKNEEIRAQVIRERNAERTAMRAELENTRRQLTREQAETTKLRARLDRGDLGERLYTAYDVWLCTVCGGRYRHHHPHPCTPLVQRLHVVITYIEEQQPA